MNRLVKERTAGLFVPKTHKFITTKPAKTNTEIDTAKQLIYDNLFCWIRKKLLLFNYHLTPN